MKNKNYSQYSYFLRLLCLAMLLAGCQTIPSDFGGDAGPLFRRGVVFQGVEGLEFRACFVEKSESVNDHTGRLAKYLENKKLHSVYAEMSGDSYVLGEPWSVYQVHLIGGNQNTCHHELSDNVYRAAGNSPLWIADIREGGIHVHDYAQMSQLVFPLTEPLNLGNGSEWTSYMRHADGEVTLRLLRETCRDRYGIEYEYRSEMVLNGKQFIGCARHGQLDVRSIPGLYTTESKQGERFVTLEIMSDGTLSLAQTYLNGQSLSIQRGTWQILKSGKLLFQITESDGRVENEVLMFKRDKRGALVLQGFSSLYGGSGFRLEKKGPEKKHRRFNR